MKSQTCPFNAKAVGEVCIVTGETGAGAVASLDQFCRIEGMEDVLQGLDRDLRQMAVQCIAEVADKMV